MLAPGWFADVLLARDPRKARAEVEALADDGFPLRDIYLDVLSPALQEVGARWRLGVITIAEEHLATAVVSSVMASLGPRLTKLSHVQGQAVLACTEGEFHAVGLRMVRDFLEADGWDVSDLGAVTPGAELSQLVSDMRPDVVCLSTTLTTHLSAAKATVAALRDLPSAPFIFVGGLAYAGNDELAKRLGADAFARDAGAASRLLRARFGGD